MKYLLTILGVAVAVFLIFFGAAKVLMSEKGIAHRVLQNGDLSLVTEPADGIVPVLRMIQNASTSIDLVMYELDDVKVEEALVAAQQRGVVARVLLNEGYYGQPTAVNGRAYEYLGSRGISVKWTSAYFALTHEKALVVDGASAMIMTFNLTPQFYATSRDFGIVDTDHADAAAIE